MESTIKQRDGQQEGFLELVDALTSSDGTKALSASQGKILKALIDKAALKKTEKRIIEEIEYTAIAEDKERYLVFENPIIFKIPLGVFAVDDELEGDAEGGDVTIEPAVGVTLLVLETQRKVLLNNGAFGMRFKTANKASLFGALKPL